jgi:hypothetical protein
MAELCELPTQVHAISWWGIGLMVGDLPVACSVGYSPPILHPLQALCIGQIRSIKVPINQRLSSGRRGTIVPALIQEFVSEPS